MSRKQEIYRDMLQWALPLTRNALKQTQGLEPYTVVDPKMIRSLCSGYAIAKLVHGVAYSILDEDFTGADISFLNFGARWFYDESAETCTSFHLFAYFIQELFKAVPEDRRQELAWDGPQGDYSWARSQSGRDAL